MNFTRQILAHLYRLGVRKVTLTPEAARDLCKTFQGKYAPGESLQESLGSVLGIEFEREHGSNRA